MLLGFIRSAGYGLIVVKRNEEFKKEYQKIAA
jgi:hypothetical protein